jgi:CRISPR-associated endonuclease Csn1
MIKQEIDNLFEKQRAFGNEKASFQAEEILTETILFQRPLKSVDFMRGYCTHLPDEKRAPKFSLSAELFVLYSKINNLKVDGKDGTLIEVTPQMRQQVVDLAYKKKKVTFSDIRKEWGLSEDFRFNFVKYGEKKEEEQTFCQLEGYHKLQKAFKKNSPWKTPEEQLDLFDAIAEIISFEFDEKKIEEELRKHPLLADADNNLIEELLKVDFSKTIRLSKRAVHQLLPYLKDGKRYDEAVALANFPQQKTNRKDTLPPLEKTNNPVVDRAMAEARKVINALIRVHGKPDSIYIELARELGKSRSLRNEIEDKQKENKKKNDTIREKIKNHNHDARKSDVIKYKLWEEQQGFCAYSGDYIQPSALFDNTNSVQVDHILPFSRSYDDSYMNKVLVTAKANQDKGNKTPYECWGGTDRWGQLEDFAQKLPCRKKQKNFLTKTFAEQEQDFKERNLNDTRYMTRCFKDHMKEHLGVEIFTINGGITNFLRHSWGLGAKDRAEDNRHHAVDAVIIACATPGIVQKVTEFNQYAEWAKARKKDPDAKKPYFPEPWEGFRKQVLDAKENIFVSRMPNRKLTGQAHKETILSYRPHNPVGEQMVKRVPLSSLSLKNLENMVDKKRNKRLYERLYELLKERLETPGTNAFKEPVYMPRNNGTEGPIVKSIRVYDNTNSGIKVRQGHADNGNMVRVDVFSKPDGKGKLKYYLCPIYVMDVMKGVLPNKLCVAGKKDWPEIDETYTFMFSLHKNDLVRIKTSEGKETWGYYVGMNRWTAAIDVVEHSKPIKQKMIGLGVKTLAAFEKYNVNYFGEKFRVKGEKRLPIHPKKSRTGEKP